MSAAILRTNRALKTEDRRGSFGRMIRIPLAIGCLLVIMSVIAWKYVDSAIEAEAEAKFIKEVEEAKLLIRERLDLYIQNLFGLQALFAASQVVERHEWASYIKKQNLKLRYPGITHFRYLQKVKPSQKDEFVRFVRSDTSVQAEGYPDFSIYPEGERDVYYVVTYLEPIAGYEETLGFDAGTDPVKREALVQAMESGRPIATRRLELVSQIGDQVGFMIYLPVYQNNARTATAEDRREALQGFVAAVFTTDDLLSGIFGKKSVHPEIGFQVYDGPTLLDERLLYDDESVLRVIYPDFEPRFMSTATINVAGRLWTLHFSALPKFGLPEAEERLPLWVLLGGIFCSFLISGILYSFASSRFQAVQIAQGMTRKLRESEHRYADLIEGAPDPIITLDRLGHIQSMNPAAEHRLGYSAPELVGKYFAIPTILTRATLPVVLEEFAHAVVGRERPPFEMEIIAKDGSSHTWEANPRPIREGGKTVAVQIMIRDITARKHAEQKIQELNQDLTQRNEELSATNKELEAFSYSVSHDLRAPLRAVSGFTNALLEDHLAQLDDEGRRFLALIQTNARNMNQLIEDLLAFSRLGRKEIHLSDIDMGEVALQAFKELKAMNADRQIEMKVLPMPLARGDLALIRQVFVNLISNAIKFTSPRQKALIQIGSLPAESETVYYVKDNGVGFDMDYKGKLFGVFQRLHTAEEFEGTGVGLAIVQRIVHRHGGRVWAEATRGEGAVFYFALPARLKES